MSKLKGPSTIWIAPITLALVVMCCSFRKIGQKFINPSLAVDWYWAPFLVQFCFYQSEAWKIPQIPSPSLIIVYYAPFGNWNRNNLALAYSQQVEWYGT